MKYQVVVGNIGQVVDTNNYTEARKTFLDYVSISHLKILDYVSDSKWECGRAMGEDVTLMEDDEIIENWYGESKE